MALASALGLLGFVAGAEQRGFAAGDGLVQQAAGAQGAVLRGELQVIDDLAADGSSIAHRADLLPAVICAYSAVAVLFAGVVADANMQSI